MVKYLRISSYIRKPFKYMALQTYIWWKFSFLFLLLYYRVKLRCLGYATTWRRRRRRRRGRRRTPIGSSSYSCWPGYQRRSVLSFSTNIFCSYRKIDRESTGSEFTGSYKEMSSILAYQQRLLHIWIQMRGGGEVAGSQPMSTAVHRSPDKLWRFNSIRHLCEFISPDTKDIMWHAGSDTNESLNHSPTDCSGEE